jgi:hypothetical protein
MDAKFVIVYRSACFRFRAVKHFSIFHIVLTDSRAPIYWILGALYPGGRRVKWQEREADHSPPYSTQIKKDGVIPPLPCMSSLNSA